MPGATMMRISGYERYTFLRPPPRLSHDEAGPIGEALARQWALLVGTPAPDAGDLVWADLVQFVLRLSRERADVSGARP
jgi:hypothetical protein